MGRWKQPGRRPGWWRAATGKRARAGGARSGTQWQQEHFSSYNPFQNPNAKNLRLQQQTAITPLKQIFCIKTPKMPVKPLPRPGGRSARVQAAVHQAARELIAEAGRDALTVPAIARSEEH